MRLRTSRGRWSLLAVAGAVGTDVLMGTGGSDVLADAIAADMVSVATPVPCSGSEHVAASAPPVLTDGASGLEVSWLRLGGPGLEPVEVASFGFPLVPAGTTLAMPLRSIRLDAAYRVRVRRTVAGIREAWQEIADTGRGWVSGPPRALVLPGTAQSLPVQSVSWPINIQPAAEGQRLNGRLERLDAEVSGAVVAVATGSWTLRAPALQITAGGLRPETRYRLVLFEGARAATLDLQVRASGEPPLSMPTALVWPP